MSDETRLERPIEQLRAATVARMYYFEDRSKVEIAEELGLNRFKVARILEGARASGLVRIEIAAPSGIDEKLSEQVRKTFGLRHVVAIQTQDAGEVHQRAALAEAGAALMSEIVTNDDVLGVGYGRTLTMMAQRLDSLARCPIVQLTGALLGINTADNSVELVRQIAARNGGPSFPMYVPQVLPDAGTAETLRGQPEVRAAHRRFSSVTTAVVAVGGWNPPSSQLYDSLPVKERKALTKQGAVAELCATLLDSEGKQVAREFTDRCIAISGEQLRAIPEVVAVAGGLVKTPAVRAVILGGHAKSLVTDTTLAAALLAMA